MSQKKNEILIVHKFVSDIVYSDLEHYVYTMYCVFIVMFVYNIFYAIVLLFINVYPLLRPRVHHFSPDSSLKRN